MKFLHIADLHLGRRMGDISLLEDQAYVLKQIVEIAKEEKADGILIAGDVYQKASPNAEAMTLFNDFVTSVVGLGIKVFVISGNHDSDQRISYFSSLIKNAGVYVSEKFEGTLQQITMNDEYGEVVINLLPFIRPANVRKCYPDEAIESYDDAIKAVLAHSIVDKSKRNILVAHQFITGAQTCESEERVVGGVDNVDASLFDAFDYVALGHIHGAQKVGRDTMRYAGSPYMYSFSETNHKKSVTIVEVKEKGNIVIDTRPLKFIHQVRDVEGMLDEILNMPYSEDFVRVIVHDELTPPDARISVGTVFPNMMKYFIQNSRTIQEVDVIAKESIDDKDVVSLFIDFFKLQNNDAEPTSEQLEVLNEVLKGLEEDKYEAD